MYPEEAGAEIINYLAGGGSPGSPDSPGGDPAAGSKDLQRYKCLYSYIPLRQYPSSVVAKCHKGTGTFVQPELGCFVFGRNWLRGQPARYAKFHEANGRRIDKATTDGSFRTYALIAVNQAGPEWSSDIDLRKGSGDDDTYWSSSIDLVDIEVVAVLFMQLTNLAPMTARVWVANTKLPDRQPQLCKEASFNIRGFLFDCQFSDGRYPVGDRIDIDIVSEFEYVYVGEVIVFGRRWKHSCSAPPPLHGMRLLNFSQTEARYVCGGGWRQVDHIPKTLCREDRTWELPVKVCTDLPNLAFGNNPEIAPHTSSDSEANTKTSGRNPQLHTPNSSRIEAVNKIAGYTRLPTMEDGGVNSNPSPDLSVLTDGDINTCATKLSCNALKDNGLLVHLSGFAEIEKVLVTLDKGKQENDQTEILEFRATVSNKTCQRSRSFAALSSVHGGMTIRYDCFQLPLGNSVYLTLEVSILAQLFSKFCISQ